MAIALMTTYSRRCRKLILFALTLALLSVVAKITGLRIVSVPVLAQTMTNQATTKVNPYGQKYYSNNNYYDSSHSGKNKMEKQIKTEKAIFGAGCFWGVEEAFRRLPGVISTTVGYCGGTLKSPSYERVCQGDTGHAEVVEVEYDPQKINYQQLLKVFFGSHDPTTLDRQGPDVGYQYRSVIFYNGHEQEKEAMAAKEQFQAQSNRPVVTAIEPAKPFYKAEEYHQHYLEKRGLNVCH